MMRLLNAALARTDFAKSQRSMVAGLLEEWAAQRLRGHSVIHPGMSKLAAWGDCTTKQARRNVRQLEAAGVLNAVSHQKGGRHAPRYELNTERLFRALIASGGNPSPELREYLAGLPPLRADILRYEMDEIQQVGEVEMPVESHPKLSLSERALQALRADMRADICPPDSKEKIVTLAPASGDLGPADSSDCQPMHQADLAEFAENNPASETDTTDAGQPDSGATFYLEKKHFGETERRPSERCARASAPRPDPEALLGDETTSDPVSAGLSADANAMLVLLKEKGPKGSRYGVVATTLGLGAKQAREAEAQLMAAGLLKVLGGRAFFCGPAESLRLAAE